MGVRIFSDAPETRIKNMYKYIPIVIEGDAGFDTYFEKDYGYIGGDGGSAI